MRNNLLIITQRVDEGDDLLGFFVSWIREFASHYERVDVIALAVGTYELPSNVFVYSLGKERNSSRLERFFRITRLLWDHTTTGGAVFAHMSPIFAIIAAPFAFIRHARLSLWYLHRSITFRLRTATLLADVVFTADASSLRLKSRKIISVGHGIDVQRFSASEPKGITDHSARTILSVGRISPIKDYGTLIRAAALLREREVSVRVEIIGRPVMPTDGVYAHELEALCVRLGVADIVHFLGFVPYRDMPSRYARADVVIGCTPTGGIDKAILEAMASGRPVITSNAVMRKYFDTPYREACIFRHGDAQQLADKIEAMVSDDVGAVGDSMRQSVIRDHNLPVTISKIVALL